MHLATYADATGFLQDAQAMLEANEPANGLMLGISFRLQERPDAYKGPPYLATVRDDRGVVAMAVMTPPHRLLVYGTCPGLTPAWTLVARDLLAHRWPVPGVLGPAAVAGEFARAWAAETRAAYSLRMQQRVYQLRRVNPIRRSPGHLRLAAEAEIDLVARWTLAFQQEALHEGTLVEAQEMAQRRVASREIYFWEDGRPVSMAASTRPTRHGISIGLVYTPGELRRHGYATSCVAALSQRLLDAGYRFCTLHTDLANPTSNHIYQEIGYTPVCDMHEYGFGT